MISYEQIAKATGKTEEQARIDRKEKLFDLDDLSSIVRYVARSWGWISSEEIPAQLPGMIAANLVPAAPPPPPGPAGTGIHPQRVYSGTTMVKDNVVPTNDPYLDRVRSQKF